MDVRRYTDTCGPIFHRRKQVVCFTTRLAYLINPPCIFVPRTRAIKKSARLCLPSFIKIITLDVALTAQADECEALRQASRFKDVHEFGMAGKWSLMVPMQTSDAKDESYDAQLYPSIWSLSLVKPTNIGRNRVYFSTSLIMSSSE